MRKGHKYAEAGVPRYWVIEPEMPEIIVFERTETGVMKETVRTRGTQTAVLDVGPTTITVTPSDLVR